MKLATTPAINRSFLLCLHGPYSNAPSLEKGSTPPMENISPGLSVPLSCSTFSCSSYSLRRWDLNPKCGLWVKGDGKSEWGAIFSPQALLQDDLLSFRNNADISTPGKLKFKVKGKKQNPETTT